MIGSKYQQKNDPIRRIKYHLGKILKHIIILKKVKKQTQLSTISQIHIF